MINCLSVLIVSFRYSIDDTVVLEQINSIKPIESDLVLNIKLYPEQHEQSLVYLQNDESLP